MQDAPQTATVIINVDGVSTPVQFTRTLGACQSLAVGVHAIPGMPPNANFRTQVGWPGLGSAGLIMRPHDDFGSVVVMPPTSVLR